VGPLDVEVSIRVEDRTPLPFDSTELRDGPTIAVATGMRWLVLLLVFASGCHSFGDSLACMTRNEVWKQRECEAERRYSREHEANLVDPSAELRQDAEIRARHEYGEAIEPCRAGDARACFVTALYEERQGASSARVESRYRFACVQGVARACFMAGTHARARVSTDVIDPRSPESASQLALASFSHGCELRDGDSCRAGWEIDPTRTDLLETACAAHYRWACTELGR